MATKKTIQLGKKVLILEDDPTMGKGIQLLLRSEGYETTLVDNSGAAVGFIDTYKPDLLITDLLLEGINGLEIYQRYHKQIPTLIITGAGETSLAAEARKIAGSRYIEKPFSSEAFKKKVKGLLKENNK